MMTLHLPVHENAAMKPRHLGAGTKNKILDGTRLPITPMYLNIALRATGELGMMRFRESARQNFNFTVAVPAGPQPL